MTLQLNLANGPFTTLDATLKDTSFSETALDIMTFNGVKVDFMGCALSGYNQISCMTKVTSINKDQKIPVSGSYDFSGFDPSKLFDNLSNEYNPSTLTALDQSDSAYLDFNIIQGGQLKSSLFTLALIPQPHQFLLPSHILFQKLAPLPEISEISIFSTGHQTAYLML